MHHRILLCLQVHKCNCWAWGHTWEMKIFSKTLLAKITLKCLKPSQGCRLATMHNSSYLSFWVWAARCCCPNVFLECMELLGSEDCNFVLFSFIGLPRRNGIMQHAPFHKLGFRHNAGNSVSQNDDHHNKVAEFWIFNAFECWQPIMLFLL